MAEPWATYSIVNLASERTIIHKTGNNKNPALNENKFKFLLPVSRPTPSWEYILNITCFEYTTAWSTLATLNLIDQFVTLTVSMPLPLLLLEMKRNCLFLCYFLWINSLLISIHTPISVSIRTSEAAAVSFRVDNSQAHTDRVHKQNTNFLAGK